MHGSVNCKERNKSSYRSLISSLAVDDDLDDLRIGYVHAIEWRTRQEQLPQNFGLNPLFVVSANSQFFDCIFPLLRVRGKIFYLNVKYIRILNKKHAAQTISLWANETNFDSSRTDRKRRDNNIAVNNRYPNQCDQHRSDGVRCGSDSAPHSTNISQRKNGVGKTKWVKNE